MTQLQLFVEKNQVQLKYPKFDKSMRSKLQFKVWEAHVQPNQLPTLKQSGWVMVFTCSEVILDNQDHLQSAAQTFNQSQSAWEPHSHLTCMTFPTWVCT